MRQFHTIFTLPFNITIPKHSQIETLNSSKKNYQYFDSTCDLKIVENGIVLYFKNHGKIYLYHIVKIRSPVIKKNSLVPFFMH